jgi:hypothetical protein
MDQLPVPGGSDNRAWELCDLSRDTAELQDVSSEYPEVTAKLAGTFAKWQSEMHPPLTRTKATNNKPK